MNVRELRDGELLVLGIYLEEQCALRFEEMQEALQFSDEELAGRFRWIAREERTHAQRIGDLRDDVGGSEWIRPDLQAWVVARYPTLMELWDPDDEDADAARRHADEIEAASEHFFRSSASATTDRRVRALFAELAEEEAAHRTAGDARQT